MQAHTNIHENEQINTKRSTVVVYTCLRVRPREHSAATSGVNEAHVNIYIHGRLWATFYCRGKKKKKPEEAWVLSKPSHLSVTMDPFKCNTL